MSDIGIMSDLWIYGFGALVVLIGVVLALLESYLWGSHRLWVLLLLVAGAGWVMTEIEPFSFAGHDTSIYGIIMYAGGLLLLAGCLFTTLSAVALGRLKRKSAQ